MDASSGLLSAGQAWHVGRKPRAVRAPSRNNFASCLFETEPTLETLLALKLFHSQLPLNFPPAFQDPAN